MRATVLVSAVLACAAVGGCSRGSAKVDPTPSSTVAPPPPPAPPPKPEGPLERILKADDYPSALGIAAPGFSDAANQTDPGALLLTAWAIPNMKLSDVAVAKDETSYALARKDSDEARGKRLCASGSLVQIECAYRPIAIAQNAASRSPITAGRDRTKRRIAITHFGHRDHP